jgi:hypothetical protein
MKALGSARQPFLLLPAKKEGKENGTPDLHLA